MRFHGIYDKAVSLYRHGSRDDEIYFSSDEKRFLDSMD